ncbi:hypothetical protein KM043_016604 [Ampulex compressa]|nr:hypothetical protein KM043_016604 [Ampulex compressa]
MASTTKKNEQELALSLGRQREVMRSLHRIKSDLLTLLTERRTSAVAARRLELVEKLWADIVEQHVRLAEAYPLEAQAELDYFADDHSESACRDYFEASDCLADMVGAATTAVSQPTVEKPSRLEAVRLPQLPLPTFSSSLLEWSNFRALFLSMLEGERVSAHVRSRRGVRDCEALLGKLALRYCCPQAGRGNAFSTGKTPWTNTGAAHVCAIGRIFVKSVDHGRRFEFGENIHAPLKDDDCPHRTAMATPCACQSRHACLADCKAFREMAVSERRRLVRKQGRCFVYLRLGHQTRDCQRPRCSRCGHAHHVLLHPTLSSPNVGSRERSTSLAEFGTSGEDTPTPSSATSHSASLAVSPRTFLATARVRRVADLRLRRRAATVEVSGLGESPVAVVRGRMLLDLMPAGSGVGVPFQALILTHLTVYRGYSEVRLEDWEHLRNLSWVDPQLSSRDLIEVLIGADFYGAVLREGLRQGPAGFPIAQATMFGWVVFDPISRPQGGALPSALPHCVSLLAQTPTREEVDVELSCFWQLEDVAPVAVLLSEDDQCCEAHFARTHERREDGSYQVRLPFCASSPTIGETYHLARSMFVRIMRRLVCQPNLHGAYREFMREYLALGHMRVAPADCSEIDPPVYLLHHSVLRKGAPLTKLRVVFNASSPSSQGPSLNDCLMVGPKLQTDIGRVLTTWRRHEFVFKADIRKMFRQIWVHPRDVDLQRVLWLDDAAGEPISFQLLKVTYGTCARERGRTRGSGGASGDFLLEKTKVLKVVWSPTLNAFEFRFEPVPNSNGMKRLVLSQIARLFDPLGWVAPVLIRSKLLMQDLWLNGVDWVDALAGEVLAS